MSKRQTQARRGTGSVFRNPNSPYWYIQWFVDGKRSQMSSGTTDKGQAEALLRQKITEHEPKRTGTVGDLLDGLERYYVKKDAKLKRDKRLPENSPAGPSLKWVRWVATGETAVLRERFGSMKVERLRSKHLEDFMDWRRQQTNQRGEPISDTTIRKELSLLHRAFNLAGIPFPKVEKPAENDHRAVDIPDTDFDLILTNMRPWAKAPVLFAYWTGCRKGEILNLKRSDVDFVNRIAILKWTKTGKERPVPLHKELVRVLKDLKPSEDGYLFRSIHGGRMKDLRGAWESAQIRAGLVGAAGNPKYHFHDLRRTAITNLARNGTPENVIMRISGHRTRSVFDRYNIRPTPDLIEAVDKLYDSHSSTHRKLADRVAAKKPAAKDTTIRGINLMDLPDEWSK